MGFLYHHGTGLRLDSSELGIYDRRDLDARGLQPDAVPLPADGHLIGFS